MSNHLGVNRLGSRPPGFRSVSRAYTLPTAAAFARAQESYKVKPANAIGTGQPNYGASRARRGRV